MLPIPWNRRVPPLRGHADEVHGVAFSPDGTMLATGGCDGWLASGTWPGVRGTCSIARSFVGDCVACLVSGWRHDLYRQRRYILPHLACSVLGGD